MGTREIASARIWMDDEGIVHYVSRGIASTAQSVDQNMQVVQELTESRRVPILFDAREWPRGNPASWARFISVVESVCVGAAAVVSQVSAKALGRFLEFIDDLVVPFEIFEDEAGALAFLRRHL